MHKSTTPVILGIAGGSGSGKTTVANVIMNRVGYERIALITHDSYYRDRASLVLTDNERPNFDHPDSLETSLLIKHLQQLKRGKSVDVPTYDFRSDTRRQETIHVDARPVILVDGILIFAEPRLRPLFDIKIFVDTDSDLRFIRRLQRDMAERGRSSDSVIHQYLATVRPMHLQFVEPSRRYADIIIPEGGFNTVAMDMVVAAVELTLNKRRKSAETNLNSRD